MSREPFAYFFDTGTGPPFFRLASDPSVPHLLANPDVYHATPLVPIGQRQRGAAFAMVEEMRALRAGGRTVREIAADLSYSMSTVTRYTKGFGRAPRRGSKPLGAETVEEIRRMRGEGKGIAYIATALGISVPTVVKYTKGVSRGINPRVDVEREAGVIDRIGRGETFDAIGAHYGISRARVGQIVTGYEKRTGETVPRYTWRKPKPEPAVTRVISLVQRLLSRARLVPETGCWEWTGSLYRTSKGAVYPLYGGKYARRETYELWRGPIPTKHFVVPQCGNELCINPFHSEPMPPGERMRQSDKWDLERGTWKHSPPNFKGARKVVL